MAPLTSALAKCYKLATMNRPRLMLATLALTGFAYAWWALVFLEPDGLWAGDEGVKLIQIKSLWRSGFRTLALDYPGRTVDSEGRFFPIAPPFAFQRDGQFYSVFPIAFPLLSAVPYKLFGLRGLHLLPILGGVGVLLLVPRLCDEFGVRHFKPVAPALIGLGTPMFFYSVLFWEHTLAAFLCTLTLLLVLRSAREGPRVGLAALSGVVLGATVWLRTETYCFAAALAVAYFLLSGRIKGNGLNVAALGLGFLALAVPLWLYNWATFGNLLGAHVKCNIEFYAEPDSGLFGTAVRLLAHPGIGEEVKNLWLMSPFLAFFVLSCAPRFAARPMLLCVCVALMVVPSVVLAFSGHFKEGLLAVTPATAYAFLRLQDLWRPAADAGVRKLRFAFCLVALYVALVAVASPVTGGLQHGPRFLLPIVPLVMILAMSGGEQLLERGYSSRVQQCLVAGFLVLAACGLTMAIRACNAAYFRKQLGHNLVAKVREYPQKVVFADHWPTPQELAALYYEKMLFLVKDQPSAVRLVEQLAAKDIREFVYLSREAVKVGAVPRTLGPARMKVGTEERLPAVGLVVAVYANERTGE